MDSSSLQKEGIDMDFKYSATAKLEEGMRVRVQTGDHEYIVDEPVEAGGTDQGAMPGSTSSFSCRRREG